MKIPCGTRAAESRHRRDGTWPCHTCLQVRADVIAQIRTRATKPYQWLAAKYAPLMTFGTFTDNERMDIAREVHRAAVDVHQFTKILGLPAEQGAAFHGALTRLDDSARAQRAAA